MIHRRRHDNSNCKVTNKFFINGKRNYLIWQIWKIQQIDSSNKELIKMQECKYITLIILSNKYTGNLISCKVSSDRRHNKLQPWNTHELSHDREISWNLSCNVPEIKEKNNKNYIVICAIQYLKLEIVFDLYPCWII